jgi:DNA-binding PadR family transcriptional regulator
MVRILQEPTPAEVAILGLVNEGETHGYGINQTIEERGMRIWTTVGFSSIYAILQRLEKAGLVRSRQNNTEKLPKRKLYRITSEGKTALRNAVKLYLSEPDRPHFRVDLGVANLYLLPKEEAITCLKAYCADLRDKINALDRRVEEMQPLDLIAEAVFDHALDHRKAELHWAETLLVKYQTQLTEV